MKEILKAVSEPSTWAGAGIILGTLAGAFGGTGAIILGCAASACGAVAMKLREASK